MRGKHGPVILLPVWVFIAAHILSAQEGYVGAEVCVTCHAEEFAAQSQSNHAKALHPASGPKSITFPPIGIGEESSDPGAAHYNFQENGSRYGVIVTVGT